MVAPGATRDSWRGATSPLRAATGIRPTGERLGGAAWLRGLGSQPPSVACWRWLGMRHLRACRTMLPRSHGWRSASPADPEARRAVQGTSPNPPAANRRNRLDAQQHWPRVPRAHRGTRGRAERIPCHRAPADLVRDEAAGGIAVTRTLRPPAVLMASAIAALLAVSMPCRAQAPADAEAAFAQRLRPLFTRHCGKCHSTEEAKGDLDLERFDGVAAIRREPGVWLESRGSN